MPALVHEMGDTYPELQRAQPLITETLHLEETRFRKTLEKGLGLLGERPASSRRATAARRDRVQALRHLRLPARPHRGRAARARRHRRHQGLRRRDGAAEGRSAQGLEGLRRGGDGTVWFEVKEKTGATEFLGYDTERAAGEIVALVKDGKEAKSLKAGDEAAIVVNQTPFYGESGGQVGDQGVIKGAKGALFRVTDTQKKAGGLFVHLGKVESGSFKPAKRSISRSMAEPLGHPRQPLGDASPARGAAPGAGRSRRAEGLARRA